MLVEPHVPAPKPDGRLRTMSLRAVMDATLYLLRSGCQWCLPPANTPPRSTVHHHYVAWRRAGMWTQLQ